MPVFLQYCLNCVYFFVQNVKRSVMLIHVAALYKYHDDDDDDDHLIHHLIDYIQ